jgi:O-antigen/teichoic acid export membrane protein
MLGLTTVGVREIASNSNDKQKVSKVFSSLLTLNMITTIIMTVALFIAILFVPKFQENSQLMYVGVFKLISKTFLVEWLYTGIEKFKFITLRSVIVRSIYVVAVLFFVRSKSDFLIYYALTTMTFVVNAIINVLYSKQFVVFSLKSISLKPYIKPVVTLGIYSVLTSMYTTFNVSYLGFIGGDAQVGYYSTATKLHHIVLALFTAFTAVMLPRMSSLLSEGNMNAFRCYINKSTKVLLAFAIPITIFCIIYADQIVGIIAGRGYEQAIPCMQIVMPLIFVIGYEQILVIQILTPLKRDSDILINSIVGAVVGILANIIIVPKLLSEGSSVVWFLSEFAVMIMAQFFVTRQTGIKFPVKSIARYLLCYMPVVIALYILHNCVQLGFLSILAASFVTAVCFLIIEILILKDDVFLGMIIRLKSKMTNKC